MILVCQLFHSLQGEAFNAADPKLVVCALVGKGRHIHEEVLGLRSSPGQRLAQCSAHMIVWIFPLIAKEWTAKVKCTFIHSLSISYQKIYCSSLRCIWKLCVKWHLSTPIICGRGYKKKQSDCANNIKNNHNPHLQEGLKNLFRIRKWNSKVHLWSAKSNARPEVKGCDR